MGDEEPREQHEVWTPEERERLRAESRAAAERSRSRGYNKWHLFALLCIVAAFLCMYVPYKTGKHFVLVFLTIPVAICGLVCVNAARAERGDP
jgi:multidrug efflux pump subunit AcrB